MVLIQKDTSIFVNSESVEELETGTRRYPYKSLTPALKEVLNEHHGSSLSVSIFVMEGTSTLDSDKFTTLNVAHLTIR